MQNNIIATATHPRDGNDIVIYEHTWSNHVLLHEELNDCGHGDCLNEIVETINKPDIIREGRKENTELFVRYTTRTNFDTFEGFSVAIKTEDNTTLMTTAYHDVISGSKGKVIWTKKGNINE